MSRPWTPEQLSAIETIDRNLLVSAAAGSGKTAVLSERFKYLVCDAPDKCDVDEILVVTFTNDAAAEMKRRIARAINERLKSQPDARIRRQAMLIHSAHISTIHGMASSILRRHFHEVGIDPNFRLLDEEEARLLRSDLASQVIEEALDDSENKSVRELLRDYCDGRFDALKQLILTIHAKLSSQLDPWVWLEQRIAEIESAAKQKPLESIYGTILLTQMRTQFARVVTFARSLQDQIHSLGEVAKYVPTIDGICAMIQASKEPIESGNWEAIRSTFQLTWERLPTITKKSSEAEKISVQIKTLKDQLEGFIDDNLLPQSEASLSGGLAANATTARVLGKLVKSFEDRYQKEKRENGTLDFNDLERFTLNLLHVRGSNPPAPSPAALEYQRQFKHIMVDEYQDVNELQETILSLLSAGGKHFAVGDIKQSIYRFRQADPRCFLRRRAAYEAADNALARVIDLQKNFRSREPLLDVLNDLFQILMTRESAEINYDQTQKLYAGAAYSETDGCFKGSPVELHLIDNSSPTGHNDDSDDSTGDTEELETTEREAVLVARRILELLGKRNEPRAIVCDRDQSTRPIEPRDIVVLLRSAAMKAEVYATVLRRAGLPVQADSKTGFFSAIEVMDIINLLKLLCNSRDDIALASFLRSPLSNLKNAEDELATIRLKYSSKTAPCFHQAFANYLTDQPELFDSPLKKIQAQIDAWRAAAESKNVSELIWQILDETAYLEFLSGLPDGQQRIANVKSLYERARAFENFQQPTIQRFVKYLRNLEDEDSDQGLPPVPGDSVNAVRVMTIHRSKGLEFPVVILPDLGKKINFSEGSQRVMIDESVGIATRVIDRRKMIHYPSITSTIAAISSRKQSIAEELRVLYVAGTRAKEHLILVGRTTQKRIAQWTDDWADHVGALPAEIVQNAATPLDWIGPAATMIANQNPDKIVIHPHLATDLDALAKEIIVAAKSEAIDSRYLSLKVVPGSTDLHAQSIIERVSYQYPHQDDTQRPAAVSVTSITKGGKIAPGGSLLQPKVHFEQTLKMPQCISGGKDLTAADAGTATHAVLQYVDFSKQLNDEYFTDLLDRLVQRRILRKEAAKLVDLEAIRWFAGTELGQQIASPSSQIFRELNLAYPIATGELVRGRIDLMIVHAGKIIIIDYKTDRVTEQSVDERTEFYRPQVEAYSTQIGLISGCNDVESHLVFLNPRLVRKINKI